VFDPPSDLGGCVLFGEGDNESITYGGRSPTMIICATTTRGGLERCENTRPTLTGEAGHSR